MAYDAIATDQSIANSLAPTSIPYTTPVAAYQDGTDASQGLTSTQGNTPSTYTVPVNQLDTSVVDPGLASATLKKVADGIPLTNVDKTILGKLPASSVGIAALSGTSPMPPPKADAYVDSEQASQNQVPIPQSSGSNSSTPSMAQMYNSSGTTTPTPQATPQGNSQEAPESLNSQDHYTGNAQYTGSSMQVRGARPPNQNYVAPSTTSIPTTSSGTVDPTATDTASGLVTNNGTGSAVGSNIDPSQPLTPSATTTPDKKGLNAKDIGQLLGNALDVVGVALSARGGVQRQTMLQQQRQLQMQQQANVGTHNQEAEYDSMINIAQARQLLPLEAQVNLDKAMKMSNYQEAMNVLEAVQTVDPKVQVAKAQAQASILAMQQMYGLQHGTTTQSAATQPGAPATPAGQRGAVAAQLGSTQ